MVDLKAAYDGERKRRAEVDRNRAAVEAVLLRINDHVFQALETVQAMAERPDLAGPVFDSAEDLWRMNLPALEVAAQRVGDYVRKCAQAVHIAEAEARVVELKTLYGVKDVETGVDKA